MSRQTQRPRARIDADARALARRLAPGEIAVIDAPDLDHESARLLVAAGASAVLNASPSSTGRHPALGPGVLLKAGIPLVDDLGDEILDVPEGTELRIDGGRVLAGDDVLAEGTAVTAESDAAARTSARAGLPLQVEAFAATSADLLRAEAPRILDGADVPALSADLSGHVLVVGPDGGADLKRYIREYHPTLVGVDGGADLLAQQGHVPDVIVGDPSVMADTTLTSGAEIVLLPGASSHHVEALGREHVDYPYSGNGLDAAILLAHAGGAQLIVLDGGPTTLEELVDAGRLSMSSAVLTRLVAGGRLIHAEAVTRLTGPRIATWPIVGATIAGLLAVSAAFLSTPFGQSAFGLSPTWLGDLLAGLF